jgi:FAD/FMN-containing dehydrogenase
MLRWQNWAGNQRCAPERLKRPSTEEELARIVRAAAGASVSAQPAGASDMVG